MLKTMVSVIGVERTVHLKIHDGLADVGIAAVSAEPATVDQWQAALGRFLDASVVDYVMERAKPGLAPAQAEGGHVVIDMTARLVVLDTPLPEMPRLGNVQTCDDNTLLDTWLPYRIPDDWEIMHSVQDWENRARERREQLKGAWQVDHRRVLYGELPSWLAQQWRRKANQLEDPTRQLQESWLLTPRDDLQGKTPRQILMAKRKFIDGDIEDQGQNWTLTGRCPPGLSPESHAFRFGGFGSHEIILYHEMTTQLLLECERCLGGGLSGDVREEVRHLEQLQQEWMHQPNETLYDQSPAAMIARERSRLPAVVPEGHSEEHDDCPICRMMRDDGQPMIWQLDNFSLDRSFATSFYENQEEWEESQRQWEALRQEVEQSDFRQQSGDEGVKKQEGVWQRSHTNMQFFQDMPPLEACSVMMFSIGGHMAELIHDLKASQDALDLCRDLHETFDDLRVVFKEQEDVWMIQSAIGAFTQVLHQVKECREELAPKCADLEDKLDFFRERYEAHFDPYSRQT